MPKIGQKRSEFKEKTLEIRRVSRVTAGGKRFSFRAIVIVGDGKGRVGLGIGKGGDVQLAVQKAKRQGEKNLIRIALKDGRTIFYDVEGKSGASRIRLKPVRENHGLIAGGPARIVLELAGVKDISAKILSKTKNKLNNARAALHALQKIHVKETKKEILPVEKKDNQ